jgi:hypothetical protein
MTTDVAITETVMVTVPVTVLLSVLNMTLQDYCIIFCKIDVCQNLDKGKPITVTTAVAITETVMVTVPVTVTVSPLTLNYLEHEFERLLYHYPQD